MITHKHGHPPTLEDVAWLAALTGLDAWSLPEPTNPGIDGPRKDGESWRPLPDPEPTAPRASESTLYTAPIHEPPPTKPTPHGHHIKQLPYTYVGCPRRDMACGPEFRGGPLSGEHAHLAYDAAGWPDRLVYVGDGERGTYERELAAGEGMELVYTYAWWPAGWAPSTVLR